MTCVLPDRICRCCESGGPCAYVLQLDARQRAELAKVLELVGLHPQPLKLDPARAEQMAKQAVEPVTVLTCDRCDRTTEMFTYLVEFLRTNHVRLPACPVCAADRRAA